MAEILNYAEQIRERRRVLIETIRGMTDISMGDRLPTPRTRKIFLNHIRRIQVLFLLSDADLRSFLLKSGLVHSFFVGDLLEKGDCLPVRIPDVLNRVLTHAEKRLLEKGTIKRLTDYR